MDPHSRPAKRCRTISSSNSTPKLKQPRLPRPQRPLIFKLPKHLTPPEILTPLSKVTGKAKDARSRSSTPTNSTFSEPPLLRLTRISTLLTAIHRRNKNQHRNQFFYRHLSCLRRSVNKLIALYEQSARLATLVEGSACERTPTTASSVRQRFETESHLRGQREVLEDHIRETIVPAAYVAFSRVVADSQFANLGMVLLGILADVVGVVGVMRKMEKLQHANNGIGAIRSAERGNTGGRLVGLSTLVTGPDHGVIVERIYDSDGDTGAGEKTEIYDTQNVEVGDLGFDVGEVVSREKPLKTHIKQNDAGMKEESPTLPPKERAKARISDIKPHYEGQRRVDVLRTILRGEEANHITSSKPGNEVLTTTNHNRTASAPTRPSQHKSEQDTTTSTQKPSLQPQIPLPKPPSSTMNTTTSAGLAKKPETTIRESISALPNSAGDKPTREANERSKEKKKSKRKGNAIDDLFSGFR